MFDRRSDVVEYEIIAHNVLAMVPPIVLDRPAELGT